MTALIAVITFHLVVRMVLRLIISLSDKPTANRAYPILPFCYSIFSVSILIINKTPGFSIF
nr:MAG TPA: hypothetical protein [Caudoviricetes sp.]